MKTRVAPADEAAIAEASALIQSGLPVAVPTETVYGLAADATNGEAVARIYAAKGRPAFNPLIVHVPDLAAARRLAVFPNAAVQLAEAHWPGPLTLVLLRQTGSPVAELVTAGLDTIAIRCPGHPVMQALLARGLLLAAPSANASGSISSTTAGHVLKTLAGKIPLILDGGPTPHGLESTIVGIDDRAIRLLRPGPIEFEELVELSGLPTAAGSEQIEAPGQLASHYAPGKPVRLEAHERFADEYLIGFGSIAGDENLSSSGDLIAAAAGLFGALHRADASDRAKIAVAPLPDHGLGAAINDRLRRAAAPRLI